MRQQLEKIPLLLKLAVSGNPGNYLLPPILAAFRKEYPNVHVTISQATSAVVIDTVRCHHAELGIVGGLANIGEIAVEPIFSDDIVLVGAPHLAEKRLTPQKLRQFTWITREIGSSTRVVTEAAWKDLGILPRAVFELPSWEAIKMATANGEGIAACSQLAIRAEVKAGSLVQLNAPAWKVQRTISLIKCANMVLSPQATWFQDILFRELKVDPEPLKNPET